MANKIEMQDSQDPQESKYFGQRLGEYYTKAISIISKLPVIYFKW